MTADEHLFLKLVDEDGRSGWGEAAPAPRITHESQEEAERALRDLQSNADWVERLLEDAEHIPGGAPKPSIRAALSGAYLDAAGRRLGRPLHRLLNLPEGQIASSVTLSIGEPKAVLKEAAEFDKAGWSTFKLKLGGPHDEAVLKTLRDQYPEATIRVDANEAWSLEEARARLRLLERQNVEFVEQPLPRDRLTESRMLAREFEIPILLDEGVLDSSDVLRVVRAEAGDGINIKLAKCGGPYEARRMIKVARDAGWKVMMGCMIESSLGIATAAHFAGVLDYADLDGNVLLENDPFEGLRVKDGVVATPTQPGAGAAPGRHAAGLRRLV